MKKTAILTLLTCSLAAPAIGYAQSFISELDRLSQAAEVAKQCDALMKAGGMDERCKALMIPALKPMSVHAVEDTKSTKAASRSTAYTDDVDVISYTATGTSATINAVVNNRVHRMQVGDVVAGWKLNNLTEYEATFQTTDKSKRNLVVGFRMPPAAPAAVVVTGTGAMGTGTGIPGFTPPIPPLNSPLPLPMGIPGSPGLTAVR